MTTVLSRQGRVYVWFLCLAQNVYKRSPAAAASPESCVPPPGPDHSCNVMFHDPHDLSYHNIVVSHIAQMAAGTYRYNLLFVHYFGITLS